MVRGHGLTVQQFRRQISWMCVRTNRQADRLSSQQRSCGDPGPHTYLRRFVNGSHLSPDAQRNVFVLSVPSIQVPEVLVPRLPPEVKEAVGNGVILKHDVVYVPVFLQREQGLNESAPQKPCCLQPKSSINSLHLALKKHAHALSGRALPWRPLTGCWVGGEGVRVPQYVNSN